MATVGRPHGLRGEVRLFPVSERPERLARLTRLWLAPPEGESGEARVFRIRTIREHGRVALVTVEGLVSREDAAAFSRWRVMASPEELPAWGPNEFALSSVLGAELFDRETSVGKVLSLQENAGRDYFEVNHDGRRVLVPAVKDWLLELDLENGRIVMALPEGLLDA